MRGFEEAKERWLGLRMVTFLGVVVPLFTVGVCAVGFLRMLGLDPSDLNRGIVWVTCFVTGCMVSCYVEFHKPLDPNASIAEHQRNNRRLVFLTCLGGGALALIVLGLFAFIAEGKLGDELVIGAFVLFVIWVLWCLAVIVYRRYQFRRQLLMYTFFRGVDEANELQ